MAGVASKQQTTVLFLSTIVIRTKRQLKKKLGNLCCARQHSVQFLCGFFTQFNLGCMGPLRSGSF